MAGRWRYLCGRLAAWLVLIGLAAGGGPAMEAWAQSKDAKPDWRDTVDFWQPQWMQRELWGPDKMPKGMQVRMLRHQTYVDQGVPKSYRGARSSVGTDSATLQAGAALYSKHCARCHGPRGMGRGDAAQSLLPSPALLAYMITRPISVDEYLLWAIADGGKQFKTEMPAFKDVLTRDEIWRVIAYMRAGFADKARR